MIFENNAIKFAFDEADGSYSVYDKAAEKMKIFGATFSVGNMNSASCGGFTVSSAKFCDAVGGGEEICILSKSENGVILLMKVRLYDDSGALTICTGLINLTGDAMQITEMYPMITLGDKTGSLVVGKNAAENHRALTGEGGFSYAHLIDGVDFRSPNLAAIVYTDRPDYAAAVLAGLTTYEFQTEIISENIKGNIGISAKIRMFDATGKRVDSGSTFFGDIAYIDVCEPDAYKSLAKYASAMAKAMHVKLNNYNNYISVCLWYVFAFSCGDRSANTSLGAMQEAQAMIDSGITKYAPPLVRLVPDEYVNPNEQLWWDEEHWQKYIHLTEPYETLKKWIDAMHEIGAVGGLYMQPTFRSDDYCKLFPGHLLFDKEENEADYTDPEFVAHMKDVYTNIRNSGVSAVFYDYTMLVRGDIRLDENSLLRPGGFADKYATNVSAYRNIFKIAKDTAGQQLMITENTWNYSGQELATGVIDAQRSKMDNVGMNREVVKSGVRQWYRNKVTKLIDPDVKNFTTTDRDIRRKEISLMGLLFGKTMLGSSITRYKSEDIHDIGRILPMPMDGITAVPVDLFLSADNDNASIFDYPLDANNHIIALLNETQHQKSFAVSLCEKNIFGGLELDGKAQYDIWDFWNGQYAGRIDGSDKLKQVLRKNECRVFAVRKAEKFIRILSTDRHILQGTIETETVFADENEIIFKASVIGGETMRVILAVPNPAFEITSVSIVSGDAVCHAERDWFDRIITICIDSEKGGDIVAAVKTCQISADDADEPECAKNLSAAVDRYAGEVRLCWDNSERMRYFVYKDDELLCLTDKGEYTDTSAEEYSDITYAVVTENTGHKVSSAALIQVSTGRYIPSIKYGLGFEGGCEFGADGCLMFNQFGEGKDYSALPEYVESVDVADRRNYCFEIKPGDVRGLKAPDDDKLALGVVCDDKQLDIDILFKDDKTHHVTLYSVDFNRSGRTMDLSVADKDGKALIDGKNIPEYGEGVHISFDCSEKTHISLLNRAVNSVVSAIYFD